MQIMDLQTLDYPIRSDKLRMVTEITGTLCDVQSPFQRIEIVETPCLGKMLLLDRHVQLAEVDERAYHEALVLIPLLSIDQPKRALVIGGGDGGVLRELCRSTSLEEIFMLEIDKEVVDQCQAHLPGLSNGAFDDPRVKLIIGDAYQEIKKLEGKFDLIITDVTDVYEEEDESLSERIFTLDFYRDLNERLTDGGFVVTQADNMLFCPYSLEGILEDFSKAFSAVGSYWSVIPSFGGLSGFAWGSRGANLNPKWPSHAPAGLSYLNSATWNLAQIPLPLG